MGAEWREVQLGDVADLLTGYPFKSQYYSQDEHDPRLVGGDNIVQGALRWDTIRRWPRTMLNGLAAYGLSAGDVVLAMDRPWIEAGLKRAVIGADDLPALLVQRTARLRGTACLETAFLRYIIGSREFTQYVLAVQTGTAVPHISPGQIRAYRFLLPPIGAQREIAHILGTLDDKIELNRRTNETLEAMARALFKSWFVDFDPVRAKAEGREPAGMDAETAKLFPGEFMDSELGPIPKGWSCAPLYDIATYVNGAAYAAFKPNSDCRGLPIVKIAELKAGITGQTKFSDVAMPEKYRLATGDVLFSWSGNPDTSIDTFVWTHGAAWLNQHIFRVVPRGEEERAWVLSTLKYLKPVFAEIARNKQTTGLGHVTAGDMKRLWVTQPDSAVMRAWNTTVGPVLERAFQCVMENQRLSVMRDALLPRLLSGEIPVDKAARMLEATA